MVLGPWPACPDCARSSGWKSSAEDPATRCLCGRLRPEKRTLEPVCAKCGVRCDPWDLYCPRCWASRGQTELAL